MRLYHRDLGGSGNPPLVILHGFLGSSRNWQTAGRYLSDHFQVFALDLRNHGDSPRADEQNYDAMVSDVEAWLDGQGLESVILMGHSMGGKVAMRFACRHPERVSRLIVVDIAPKGYPESHRTEFSAMRALDLPRLRSRREAESVLEPIITDWGLRKFLLTNIERDPDGSGFRWLINLDVLERSLPELEADSLAADDHFDGPVLFVRGGRSNYFRPGDEALVDRHFPDAKLVTLNESGHNPHFDAREAFVEAILGFSVSGW